MISVRRAWWFAILLSVAPSPARSEDGIACRNLSGARPLPRRLVQVSDLLHLRDFGSPESGSGGLSGASISPDGKYVALQLRQADAQSNSYCLAIILLPLRPGGRPRVIDEGGAFMNHVLVRAGIPSVGLGLAVPIIPRWSPDGRRLAWLRRDAGRTRPWVADIAIAGGGRALANIPGDAEALSWRPDGTLLVGYRSIIRQDAIESAARNGMLYDARVNPLAGPSPTYAGPLNWRVIAADGGSHAATTPSGALANVASDVGQSAGLHATSNNGARAWVVPRVAHRYDPPDSLRVRFDSGERRCDQAACDHLVGLWWSPDGGELWFLAKSGWGDEDLAMYRWRSDMAAPARAWQTRSLLVGCQLAGAALLCAQEQATRPRRLVLIDPITGAMRTLFDPNPAFGALTLGSVRRLHWRNNRGIQCFGDLVLPPDYRRGERRPLIVVQYRSRGFLRGGTGDEAPIQALAARGFAVLSFERPADIAKRARARDEAGFEQAETRHWADRRSVQSALARGVRLTIAMGVADPQRIGIAGLSEGATITQWALIHSRIFRAAVMSSCEDPSVMALGGPALAAAYRRRGFPAAGTNREFWRPYALSLNASHVQAPILFQSADREYLATLEAVSALQAARRPVELDIFPDEYHVIWQPAHRLATYNHVIDWFEFWLRGIETGSDKAAQYARWHKLRDAQRGGDDRLSEAKIAPMLLRRRA